MVSSFRGFITIPTSQLAIVYVVIETEGFINILSYPELSHCSLYHYNCFSTINFHIGFTSSVLKFYAWNITCISCSPFSLIYYYLLTYLHCSKIHLLSKRTTFIYQERLELSYCRWCHVSTRMWIVHLWNAWLFVSTAVESNLLNLLKNIKFRLYNFVLSIYFEFKWNDQGLHWS